MTEIMGEKIVEHKASAPTEFQRNAICLYLKISGKGCTNCSFCRSDKLCVRSSRTQPTPSIIEDCSGLPH